MPKQDESGWVLALFATLALGWTGNCVVDRKTTRDRCLEFCFRQGVGYTGHHAVEHGCMCRKKVTGAE